MIRRLFLHWKRILVLSIIVGGLGGGYAYHQHQKYKHFAVHQEGMVFRSAWLDHETMSEVIETYQIRTVVNLCEPGEMGEERWAKEREAVKNAGARLIELPMPLTVDVTDPQIAEHLKILENPNNYPLLVHCQHGVTRTAKFLSIYDIAFRNMTGEKSLKDQPLFGRKDHNVHVKAFVNNFEKQHKRLYPDANAKRLEVLGMKSHNSRH